LGCPVNLVYSHGRDEKCISAEFWLENLKRSCHLESLGANRMLLKWILEKYVMRRWSGFIWLRTGNNGGLLISMKFILVVP
jgi:hypothetical protein